MSPQTFSPAADAKYERREKSRARARLDLKARPDQPGLAQVLET